MTKKQTIVFEVIQDLVLAFVINSAATILNGGFQDTWTYLVGMFEAFSINYVAGLAFPVVKAGIAAANATKLKEGSLGHKFVRVFVTNAIFVTIISFTIALINVGPSPDIFKIWIQTYPVLHLVGLCTSFLTEKSCQEIAKTIVKD